MPLDTARIHDIPDDPLAAIDYCYEQGWTDGLPVVPPALKRVEDLARFEGRPPEAVLAVHPATGLECTVHAAAVNAVMAGCKPEYFPVVIAALEAMNEPDFNFHGSAASTGGSAPLLIVSGPIIDDIGMNCDVNLYGPGNRANNTIGRAIRLILMNVFQMIPGLSDKSTQGHPGKFSFCIAERQRDNPWPLLVEDLDYPESVSSVTVFAGGGFCNIENHGGSTPEMVLTSIADAMANYGCVTLGQSVVVLSPEHCRVITRAGWSKRQVQEFLYTTAARPVDGMQSVGKFRQDEYDRQHGEGAHPLSRDDMLHRGLSPEDILVVMGGGDAGGHSSFIPSWSRKRGSLMQSKPIGVCIDCGP